MCDDDLKVMRVRRASLENPNFLSSLLGLYGSKYFKRGQRLLRQCLIHMFNILFSDFLIAYSFYEHSGYI